MLWYLVNLLFLVLIFIAPVILVITYGAVKNCYRSKRTLLQNFFILLIALIIVIPTVAITLFTGYVFIHNDRAEFDLLANRLFTYEVSRTTFIFEGVAEEEKANIIKHLNFMLSDTVSEINYHGEYMRYGHIGSYSKKARVPAYYKWTDNELIIISGKPYSQAEAHLLKLYLDNMLLKESLVPTSLTLNINGTYSGEIKVNLLKARFVSSGETKDIYEPFSCSLELPLLTPPILKNSSGKRHLGDGMDSSHKLEATFLAGSTISQNKIFEVSQLNLGYISLVVEKHASASSLYSKAYSVNKGVICDLLSPHKLGSKLQLRLAKNMLGDFLFNLSLKSIALEPNVSFSPWYADEAFIAVD